MDREYVFTNIYSRIESGGFLSILFYNKVNNAAVLFDGYEFFYDNNLISIPEKFIEIEYSLKLKNRCFSVESFKQSWDVSFVKLRNGDIFQIYSVADNNQLLAIFSNHEHQNMITPMGISIYEAAQKRYEEAEYCTPTQRSI